MPSRNYTLVLWGEGEKGERLKNRVIREASRARCDSIAQYLRQLAIRDITVRDYKFIADPLEPHYFKLHKRSIDWRKNGLKKRTRKRNSIHDGRRRSDAEMQMRLAFLAKD